MFSSSSTTSRETLRSPASGVEKFSLAVFCLSVAVAIKVKFGEQPAGGSEGNVPPGYGLNSDRRILQEKCVDVQALKHHPQIAQITQTKRERKHRLDFGLRALAFGLFLLFLVLD